MAKLKEPETMEECAYFSKRSLEEGHKLILWVLKDAPTMLNVNFECSKCKHEDSFTEEFKLPLTFNCPKCGLKITIKPLKGKKRGLKKKT